MFSRDTAAAKRFWTPANIRRQEHKPPCYLFQRGILKEENVNGTEQYSAAAGKANAEPPGGEKTFRGSNVDAPRPCACFLWCPRSSTPGPVGPARWPVSQGCRTPPDTGDKRRWNKRQSFNLKKAAVDFQRLAPRSSHSLVVDDVLVFPGNSGGPFPGLLVQTVLLRRPRLRLQLTTLIDKKQGTRTWVDATQGGVRLTRRSSSSCC